MFGLSDEEKLERFLNERMPGHNFRVTGKFKKGFHWEGDGLPSQQKIVEMMIDKWLDDRGWEIARS